MTETEEKVGLQPAPETPPLPPARRGGSAGAGFSSAKKSGWAGCTGRDAGAFSARRSVGRLSERSVLI